MARRLPLLILWPCPLLLQVRSPNCLLSNGTHEGDGSRSVCAVRGLQALSSDVSSPVPTVAGVGEKDM